MNDQRTVPYDLLEGLEGKAKAIALHLFAMAGQLWMSNGYLFDEPSSKVLDEAAAVEVYDGETMIKTFANRDEWLHWVLDDGPASLGYGADKPLTLKAQLTAQEYEQLRTLRWTLKKQLETGGAEVAESFAVFAAMMGEKGMTTDELREHISSKLK